MTTRELKLTPLDERVLALVREGRIVRAEHVAAKTWQSGRRRLLDNGEPTPAYARHQREIWLVLRGLEHFGLIGCRDGWWVP